MPGQSLSLAAAAAFLILGIPGGALAAGPADLYYERVLMGAADARCRLFTPEIGAALNAAAAQARGASLRAGFQRGQLDQIRDRARAKAAAVECRARDLAVAAGRVRSAFQGYARLDRLTYPGDVAGWRAFRVQPSQGVSWKVVQDVRFGADGMRFGLAGPRGQPGSLIAVARFADGQTPYAARLLIRDQARTSGPYLGAVKAGASARLPLSARVPPRAAMTAFMAEARSPADPALAEGERTRIAFRFPRGAVAQLSELDPREAAMVEFVFTSAGRDRVRTAYVEVGDFAAAVAFLNAGR
jgi:hypothetical protein